MTRARPSLSRQSNRGYALSIRISSATCQRSVILEKKTGRESVTTPHKQLPPIAENHLSHANPASGMPPNDFAGRGRGGAICCVSLQLDNCSRNHFVTNRRGDEAHRGNGRPYPSRVCRCAGLTIHADWYRGLWTNETLVNPSMYWTLPVDRGSQVRVLFTGGYIK